MNLRQLRSFVAIAETGTLSGAADAVGLSHSAVSLHVKALEEELGVPLIDRSRRPPVLTDRGTALVAYGRRLADLLDEMAALGSEDELIGSINAGVVPSAMTDLMPPALAKLRAAHPKLKVRIHTALSGDLASLVRGGELDVAVSTAPKRPLDGLDVRAFVDEPLFVIAPRDVASGPVEDILTSLPFIWFSRKTWAGQQIEQILHDLGIVVRDDMEVDSLLAVTALVSHGLGVSVVPHHPRAPDFPDSVMRLPFGEPQYTRQLALLERPKNPKRRLTDALLAALE